jgi:hypothetical protein
VTAAVSMHPPSPAGQSHHGGSDGLAGLQHWRAELYACFGRRAAGLMDLVDALAGGQHVDGLAHLSLQAAYRCGWASTYEVVRNGRIDVQRLRVLLAQTRPLSAGQPVYAVDVTTWPRRAAECSPLRQWHYHPLRHTGGKPVVAAWVYSWVCQLGMIPSSWTQPVDIWPVGPHADADRIAARQVRGLLARAPATAAVPLVCLDQGYDPSRLQVDLAGVRVQLLVRVRANRCWYADPPPRRPGARGRPARHGHKLHASDPATWPQPSMVHTEHTRAYGQVRVWAWQGVHPKQRCPGRWPIVRGTLLRVQLDHTRAGIPTSGLWLWWAGTGTPDLGLLWRAYLRRFDIEHTIGFVKQQLGWTTPRLRTPAQAMRWTWLVMAAYTLLRLARPLVADVRLPWQRPQPQGRATPARARQGFPRLLPALGSPARTRKPRGTSSPGRPKGHRSTPARRHPVHTRTS